MSSEYKWLPGKNWPECPIIATGVSLLTHGSMALFMGQGLTSYPSALTAAGTAGEGVQISAQLLT